ncbi:MAG: hypothetical protein RDU76_09415 [Candidatus Edwardsbacteria bacterium]|nr:hypothetical protein [Candidatus Edwardsbacteria bacterium]
MNNKAFLFIVFIGLFAFVGCQSVQTVTKNELNLAASKWKEPKVSIWYYTGTKEGYDYFVHQDLGETVVYRVSSKEMIIDKQFPLTKKRKLWRVMNWGITEIQNR